jgi:hypothetical protein
MTIVVAKVEDRVAIGQRGPSRSEQNCHDQDDRTAEHFHERTLPKAES